MLTIQPPSSTFTNPTSRKKAFALACNGFQSEELKDINDDDSRCSYSAWSKEEHQSAGEPALKRRKLNGGAASIFVAALAVHSEYSGYDPRIADQHQPENKEKNHTLDSMPAVPPRHRIKYARPPASSNVDAQHKLSLTTNLSQESSLFNSASPSPTLKCKQQSLQNESMHEQLTVNFMDSIMQIRAFLPIQTSTHEAALSSSSRTAKRESPTASPSSTAFLSSSSSIVTHTEFRTIPLSELYFGYKHLGPGHYIQFKANSSSNTFCIRGPRNYVEIINFSKSIRSLQLGRVSSGNVNPCIAFISKSWGDKGIGANWGTDFKLGDPAKGVITLKLDPKDPAWSNRNYNAFQSLCQRQIGPRCSILVGDHRNRAMWDAASRPIED
ncbi:hypothetical protein GYMLUDRAFT_254946 [Collybiopsis luxurians FD-317 M1]|nr:hypothetical protein GYMLUDRAFT_254946 [Collybiopsis luxurians FD-317 M1]